MGLMEFSEDAFRQQIQYISIVDKGRLVFHFFDGRDIEAEWKTSVQCLGIPRNAKQK